MRLLRVEPSETAASVSMRGRRCVGYRDFHAPLRHRVVRFPDAVSAVSRLRWKPMKKCTYCGGEASDEATVCPMDGQPLLDPNAPPPVPIQKGANGRYLRYEDVPWYRREPGPVALIGLLFCGFIAMAICIICLTGDVYKKPKHPEPGGELEVWGVGNKIAAVMLLFVQVFLYYLFSFL